MRNLSKEVWGSGRRKDREDRDMIFSKSKIETAAKREKNREISSSTRRVDRVKRLPFRRKKNMCERAHLNEQR